MKNLLKRNLAFLSISAAILLHSCTKDQPQAKSGQVEETGTSGKVAILCDESIYGFLKTPVGMFSTTYPEAQVTFESAPARRAMGELLSGRVKGIIIARNYLPDEDSLMKAYSVTKHERQMIAKDALVFFTGKSFPVDTLNREQLKKVLTTQNALLKNSFPVLQTEPVFVTTNENSSEYANLLTLVTDGAQPKHSFKTVQTADSVLEITKANPNVIGIGYLSRVALDTNLKLLKIGFKIDSTGKYVTAKIVHQSHIVMGNYPFIVPIYTFMLENRTQQPAWGLFSFLARDTQVQQYFLNAGIVPGFGKFELIQE